MKRSTERWLNTLGVVGGLAIAAAYLLILAVLGLLAR